MRVHGGVLAVLCSGIAFAGAHLAQAQEAASANLPDQFQTGDMAVPSKLKKKKSEAILQPLATAPRQDMAAPEQTPVVEQPPPPVLPAEEKKTESGARSASIPSTHKPAHMTEQSAPREDSETAVESVQEKRRLKRRPRPAQREEISVPPPVPMSLSVAQSMAIKAPLPQYPYEAKRRDLTGSGVCVVTVDPGTGKVTDATMEHSTGSRLLDKVTIETFKSWQFKPGTVSQVRLPISYE